MQIREKGSDETMQRRFKEARVKKQLKVTEVAGILDVVQSTISAWETGRKEPNIETIAKLAKLYGVSIEYLLGYDSFEMLSHADRIPAEVVRIFHGKPVWVTGKGWALVNASDNSVVYADGSHDEIGDNIELYFAPPAYTESELRTDRPLLLDELYVQTEVWVEPISEDTKLREALRGRYAVREEFVENTRGSRFHFDGYGATWVAYPAE